MSNKLPTAPQQHIVKNKAGWPNEVIPLFERALTCEASLAIQ